jgi:ribonuclease P protein component
VKRGFRLTRSAEIKKIRRNGKKLTHPFFLLVTQPNAQKGIRVAVTAGRSIGGAVQRNRAKRVLRAAIQPLTTLIKPDLDILLIAKPAIRPVKSNELQLVIRDRLKRSKLLQ